MFIQEAIVTFENFLQSYRKENLNSPLLKPVNYILSLGGKRIRPAVVIWINQLYNGDLEDSLKAALAIEMFHNFSLVHDDIMDEAPLRRGKKTVHSKWNTNTAILSGDAMLVLVYQLFSGLDENKLKASLELFNVSALNVCEGQQLDMDFEDQSSISMEQYIQMIGLKTGDLLGASFALGALLADAPKEDVENLFQFGKKTGIAFQLQDDILDLFGDQEKVGKQIGGDIIANKKTCLWISAFEKANEEQLAELEVMANETEQFKKVGSAIRLFKQLEVKEETNAIKTVYQNEAFVHLDSTSLSTFKKEEIKNFAISLLGREF
jgi:geranylgeranyl diphosphate synthase type II